MEMIGYYLIFVDTKLPNNDLTLSKKNKGTTRNIVNIPFFSKPFS